MILKTRGAYMPNQLNQVQFIINYNVIQIMLSISRKYVCKKMNLSSSISYLQSYTNKFIDFKTGTAENMFINQRNLLDEDIGDGFYLMRIKAIGINRAEILHRLGKYPINSQAQKYLGLQAAGEVYDPITKQKIFNGIALLSGGSYAQWAKIPKSHVMILPSNLSFSEGASIPQAWITAYQILKLAELQQNNSVVIYAGASGVGTAATQISKHILKCKPFCVVSTEQKGKVCLKYGAQGVVYYKDNKNWAKELLHLASQKQIKHKFNAVLDCICVSNINETIKLLQIDGRWVLYGTMSGIKSEINFGQLLGKRLKIISTTLKSRSKEYKDQLISNFSKQVLPKFGSKQIQPVVHKILQCDWSTAGTFIEAHKIMENNQNSGKIIIEYSE